MTIEDKIEAAMSALRQIIMDGRTTSEQIREIEGMIIRLRVMRDWEHVVS